MARKATRSCIEGDHDFSLTTAITGQDIIAAFWKHLQRAFFQSAILYLPQDFLDEFLPGERSRRR
jgi:hypothetical protein